MNRCLKLSVLSALALASGQVLAMDLGQIQVKSALDKPLLAEIPLTEDYPGEAEFVKVVLAPADAFARAGIRRDDLKVPLQFEVVTGSDGGKFIRVTSTQPVHEPYLDFLLQVSWPKGKLLREYTVLLDPLNNHAAPRTTAPAAGNQTTAKPRRATSPAPAPAAARTSDAGGEYGPVQHGDTLSHIALANQIDGISYQQMLLALKTANPDAFFKDNVNALKSGAVLRIPTRAEADATTRAAAVAAVREQNQAWQNQRSPTMVAGAGGSDKPVGAGGDRSDNGDHLSLVPPDEKDGTSGGAAAGSGDASAKDLRQQLARSKEALSSQNQAAAELTSRVEALEQLEQKNKRLLSLKNAEIAELGKKLAQAREKAGLPALSASSVLAQAVPAAAGSIGAHDDVADTVDAESDAATVSASSAPEVAADSADDVVAQPPAVDKPANDTATTQAAATAATTKRAPVATPWYKQLWVRIVLVLVIIGLLLWALLRRRRGGQAAGGARLSEQFGDSPLGEGAGTDAVAQADADYAFDDDEDDDGEGELLTALAADPENIGLHLELASLYYARGDADRFEAIAESMHNYVDEGSRQEWAEVQHMGRELVPDHPLFRADADAVVAEPSALSETAPFEMADDLDVEPDGSATSDRDMAVGDDGAFSDAGADIGNGEQEREQDDAAVSSTGYSFDFNLIPEPDAPAPTHAEPMSGADADDRVETSGLPSEAEFDSLPPLDAAADIDITHDADTAPGTTAVSWSGGETFDNQADTLSTGPDVAAADDAAAPEPELTPEGFSDDPVDTKLDLARAYIDMADAESARAMLHEAMNEGSQMQQDVARKLLDGLH